MTPAHRPQPSQSYATFTGVDSAILKHVVAEARKRKYTRLSQDTGTTELHAPAVALDRSAGFVSSEPFASYQASPHNQLMTLHLAD
ncbi:hypothetical protein ACVIJ6_000120 [Bradyrhizobium sp. USDA 4369]